MHENYDEVELNPFIHGTSSQTLSMMQRTNFQLMPVIAMLQLFKEAPMIGELTRGGFCIIGDGSNSDTMVGAPAFGRMTHSYYGFEVVIRSYAKCSRNPSLDTCIKDFKDLLARSHKSAFAELNLLMIYLVRLRQLNVKISSILSLDQINIFKERLNATVQFYYFILCIQKYIFIDGAEIGRFANENNLISVYHVGDYIKHYFSFETFLEKIRRTGFNIEEIYVNASRENINKLIDFIKIPKGSAENVERYPSWQDNFVAQREYNFFTQDKYSPASETDGDEINNYLFKNASNYALHNYLEQYYSAYKQEQAGASYPRFPKFAEFHVKTLSHLEALKDRIKLCNSILDAADDAFAIHDNSDKLLTDPFPVVFVTEAKTIQEFGMEYRSKEPLQLGKEIFLVATDNKVNQQRLRDYLQKNNVGPVEVLFFDDLQNIHSRSFYNNYFDAFANDDLIRAFALAKEQNCEAQFSKLYRALSELNEKRYRFKSTNPDVYQKLNELFVNLQQNMLNHDKSRINFSGIQNELRRNSLENYALYASHRGALGIIDTILTILASLVVFYPITYFFQKNRNLSHTFFVTDTESRIDYALNFADEAVRLRN